MSDSAPEDARFRLLYVCTGNICRSAFAEALTRHLLRERLGAAAAELHVSSAGTHAVVGWGLHPDTAAQLGRWGCLGPPAGFAARQLTADMVEQVDLVLGIEPQHRSAVVGCTPAALSTGFSLREFAYLASSVDAGALATEPVARALELVEQARRLRGVLPPLRAADLRVPDPMGGPPEAHRIAAELVANAVITIVDILVPAQEPT